MSFEYVLRLGDNTLVLAQHLSAWTGHGPVLEEDIALANVALDLFGQTRALLTHAGSLEGKGRTEDDLAFERDVLDFHNVLLVEQPNGDFGQTIVRQFLFDAFHLELLERLQHSTDRDLAAICARSLKEVRYHLDHSRQWLVRLGDGTEESHRRVADALDRLWPFTGDMLTPDDVDEAAHANGVAPDLNEVREAWSSRVAGGLREATLSVPEASQSRIGGKRGHHSEHLGFLLAELQFLPRAYPDAQW